MNFTSPSFPAPSGNEALGSCPCGDPDLYHNKPDEPSSFGPDMTIASSSELMGMIQYDLTIQYAVLKLKKFTAEGGDALLPTVCKQPIITYPKVGQKRMAEDDLDPEDVCGEPLPTTPPSPHPIKRRRKAPKSVINSRIFFSLPPGSHKIGDSVINIAPKNEEFQPSRMGVMSAG